MHEEKHKGKNNVQWYGLMSFDYVPEEDQEWYEDRTSCFLNWILKTEIFSRLVKVCLLII